MFSCWGVVVVVSTIQTYILLPLVAVAMIQFDWLYTHLAQKVGKSHHLHFLEFFGPVVVF